MNVSSSARSFDTASFFVSERRRSRRIPLTVPLIVNSRSPQVPFAEYCKAVVVNAHGCQLHSPRPLKRGMLVRLDIPHSDRIATAAVVHCEPLAADLDPVVWNCGLALEEPGNFWGVCAPPEDWTDGSDHGRRPGGESTREPASSNVTPPLEVTDRAHIDRALKRCTNILRENDLALRRIQALMERGEGAGEGGGSIAVMADAGATESDRPTGIGADRAAGEWGKTVEQLKAEVALLEARVRREQEQVHDWFAQELQPYRDAVRDALTEATGQIRGRIDVAVQMAQDLLERRVRDACGQLEGLGARKIDEAAQRWDEIATRVETLRSELERDARALLETRQENVKAVEQVHAILDGAMASIGRVLRAALDAAASGAPRAGGPDGTWKSAA